MSAKNSQINVPQAKQAMGEFRMQAASNDNIQKPDKIIFTIPAPFSFVHFNSAVRNKSAFIHVLCSCHQHIGHFFHMLPAQAQAHGTLRLLQPQVQDHLYV